MSLISARSTSLLFFATSLCALPGCGGEEVKYQPRPAITGEKASMPSVPSVPKLSIKQGEAYTIAGITHQLRSRVHRKDVAGKAVSITGYITKSNLADAPKCAVHKAGKADPEDCKAPIPAFWIGDQKETPEAESIKVMGWASNFAQIFDAIKEFDKGKKDPEYMDTFWGVKVPNPLPAPGAKVTVSGTYSTTFTQASTGAEADPYMGILAFKEYTIQEEAPEPATLPGIKRRGAKAAPSGGAAKKKK